MTETAAVYVTTAADGTLAASEHTHQRCPFCNCAAGLIPYQDYGVMKYRVGCEICDTQGGLYATEAQAWHAWDMRGGAVMFTLEDNIWMLVSEVLDGIEQEWVDQRVTEQLEENGRIWDTVGEGIKADVAKRMTTFRDYLAAWRVRVRRE